MGTLGRTSTKILLNEMKGGLQNWVVGLWRYLSLPIYSGTMLFYVVIFSNYFMTLTNVFLRPLRIFLYFHLYFLAFFHPCSLLVSLSC